MPAYSPFKRYFNAKNSLATIISEQAHSLEYKW